MNTHIRTAFRTLLMSLIFASGLEAQPTAFAYQGRLSEGGSLANGVYDLQFTLYDAVRGGSPVTAAVTHTATTVAEGLFIVSLDFGDSVFSGPDRWLAIGVRTNGSPETFTDLGPRQRVTSSPYTIYAKSAAAAETALTATWATSADTIPWSGVSGVPSGFADGADNNTTYTAGPGLQLNGSEFLVDFTGTGAAATAARADHDHIGAYAAPVHVHDTAELTTGTLSGDRLPSEVGLLDVEQTWQGTNNFAGPVIITNLGSVVSGSVIAAGSLDEATLAPQSVSSMALMDSSVNSLQLAPDAVTGDKIADGSVGLSDLTTALGSDTFWRLDGNTGTTSGPQFLGTTDEQPLELRVQGRRALRIEPTAEDASHGGIVNVVGGSPANRISDGVYGATISGGGADTWESSSADQANIVESDFATVAGGIGNTIQPYAANATISGGQASAIRVNANSATIAGGLSNLVDSAAYMATIAGGAQNTIHYYAKSATIAGGYANSIGDTGWFSSIGGGDHNSIGDTAEWSVISGGYFNSIGAELWAATIAGGWRNTNLADFATVWGGQHNLASGLASTAGGTRAKAVHSGTFVWADSGAGDFSSTTANQFSIRAQGGVRFATAGAGMSLDGQAVLAGNVPDGLLSSNVALRNGGNAFAGNQVVSSGRIGIGTSAPEDLLDIRDPGGGFVRLTGGDASNIGLRLREEAGPRWALFIRGWQSDNLVLKDETLSGSDLMTFQLGTRRVGINRVPSGNALEVEGNASKTTAGSWLANSDRRIKTRIRPLTDALEVIGNLRPVGFRYTHAYRQAHPHIEDREYFNVIAQDFARVFPQAVQESGEELPNGEAILQVDTYPAAIHAIAAIQELNAKVEQQETTIDDLRQELQELRRLIQRTKPLKQRD